MWEWANDPVAREWAFSSEPIPWEDHVQWLDAQLSDPRRALYVGSDERGPVGHVRFAPTGNGGEAEISVSIAPDRRGEHLGAPLIDAGTRCAATDLGCERVLARIKPGNVASERAFVAADFDPDGVGSSGAQQWLRYTRRCHGDSREVESIA